MREGLSEADSRVESEVFRVNAGGCAGVEDLLEKSPDFSGDASIGRGQLHVVWCALHVHDYGAGAGFADDPSHSRVAEAAYVIDDACAGFDCGTCDCGLAGVNGDGDAFLLGESVDD